MAMFLMMNPPRKKRRGRKGRRRSSGRCPSGAGYAQRLASGKHAGKRLHAFLKRFRSARRKYGAVRKQRAFRAEMRKPLQARSYYTPKWKRSVGKLFGTAANPRRRRSRRRNYSHWIPDYTMTVASNPYWIPRYAMNNPGGVRGLVKAPLAGYAVPALTYAGVAAVGFVGNRALKNFLAGVIPLGFIKSGIGNNLFGIATAGLLGAGVGMLNKKWGAAAFGGAMTQALVGIVGPLLPRSFGGTGWLGDYLTVGDAASARALGDLGCMGAGCLGQMTIADEIATNGYALEASSGTDSMTPESFDARRIGGNVHNASNTYPSVPLLGLGMDNIQRTATEELATS